MSRKVAQSQPARGKARAGGDSDSDENAGVTSNGTSSQAAAASTGSRDIDSVVRDVIRYLLIVDQKKLPIKVADIRKNAMKEQSRSYPAIMAKVAENLKYVFGISLVEIEIGKQKAFVLVNDLDNKYDAPHQTWSREDQAHTGLVMVVLSTIFMKGNVLHEDDLFDMFRRLGINTGLPDEVFGDVKRYLTVDLVRNGYLEVEREAGDPPKHLFRWGPRARAETTKRNVIDFVSQVFGDENQERWKMQLQDIEQSEAAGSNGAATAQEPAQANGH